MKEEQERKRKEMKQERKRKGMREGGTKERRQREERHRVKDNQGCNSTQLSKYYNEDKDDWDDYLQSVVYAYNTCIHATTGFTPYELAFVRREKSPFDPTSNSITLPRPDEFYKRLQRTRSTILKTSPRELSPPTATIQTTI
jgi:hypothetical protein